MIDGFSEDELVEQPAIALLGDLGWETVNLYQESFGLEGSPWRSSRRDAFLTKRLRMALEKLNPDLPGEALDLAVDELTRPRGAMAPANANCEVLEALRDGVKVKFRDADHGGERTETVRFIDWRDVSANDFVLASQVWFKGELHERRADLVGFVNGAPLLFIELKAGHKSAREGYDNNLRDYRDTIPQVFDAVGITLVSNGIDALIGPSPFAPWDEAFKAWKRIDDETAEGVVSLETALRAACTPERLLDLVENFLIFEQTAEGLLKKVAQNHQFIGVNRAVQAVRDIHLNKGKLGVFWHTQGSGKSLSMVTFARKVLRTLPGSWSFLIITDRDELDLQIAGTFAACGALSRPLDEVRAGSRDHLKTLLQGNDRFIFTLIQKFGTAKGETYPLLSERSDIIVIADEAHRTQYDVLAANMRRTLPNAAFIGFTGTPLMAGEEKTRDVFGSYVSTYTYQQSTEDGATVPLFYENRIPEVQLDNEVFEDQVADIIDAADLDEDQERELERRLGRQYHVITRDDRLDRIADDLVRHFVARGYRGKGMFIAIDKATALRMYDKVQVAWAREIVRLEAALKAAPNDERAGLEAALGWMRETDMAVVVSQGQNEIADMAAKGLDIRPHRTRMNIPPDDPNNLARQFKRGDSKLRLAFVCAMWITGFDVPTCSTIYLDKPMKNHTLMQTIARANRNAPGKRAGLIVDYVGVFRNLQRALAIYTTGSGATESPVQDKAALVTELETATREASEYCARRGVQPASLFDVKGFERLARVETMVDALNGTDGERRAYFALAANVWGLFKAVMPDPRAEPFRRPSAAIQVIAERMRMLVGRPEVSAVQARIEALLDQSITGVAINAPIRDADDGMEGLFDLSAIDFEKLKALIGKPGAKRNRAQALRRAVAEHLAKMVAANPMRARLLEKFQKLIADYNAGSTAAEEFLTQLLSFVGELDEEDRRGIREGLSDEELAIFDILTKPEPELNVDERDAVKQIAKDMLDKLKSEKLILDWRLKERAKAAVRVAIQQSLDALPPAYADEIWADKVGRTYQWVFERY
ncbi:MAG TPA: type I restriction endonuclease subunit R [Caulobacteraceae bacterium]|jgi:type I restriction enzyme R subunit